MAKITINGVTLDPEHETATLAAHGQDSPDVTQSNYILVQTSRPVGRAERDALAQVGATILESVPENTYLCAYPPSDLTPVRALPFVNWANKYLEGFKVAPNLATPEGELLTRSAAAQPLVFTSMSKEPRDVEVVLHRNVDARMVADRIAAAARLDPTTVRVASNGKVRLRVQPQHLPDVAALDEVRHIEEHAPLKLFNHVALEIMGVDQIHSAASPGLEGEGQTIGVCDTGLDKGSTSDVHPAFGKRVKRIYPLGRAAADDPDGHGTHVCGSVLGDGFSAAAGEPVRGAAPKASLVMQSVLDASGGLRGIPEDLHDLFAPVYTDDGVRVHSNSWGSAVAGRYTTHAYEVDDFVWTHRDCVIVFAAGNEGVDADGSGVVDAGTVGSPATAKNCIAVGASESRRPAISKKYGDEWPSDYPAEPLASDLWADDPDGLAAFSSRGPTRDGRIRPDVVAPGTAIFSTLSRKAHVGDFWGSSPDKLYCFMGGTSMATPLVAGCAALLREYLARDHKLPSPSAALVKALLINGARDITGQYLPSEAPVAPNHSEGFGRVDMTASTTGNVVVIQDEAAALDTDEQVTVDVPATSNPNGVKVTLVWTDAPGEGLQNDLDLVVTTPAGELHGNMPAGSTSFDRKNNVEQVTTVGGPIRITVRAYRITRPLQPFALVVRAL